MVTVVDVTEIRVHAVRCDGVTHAHACFLPSLLSFVGVHRKRGDGSPLARPFISCAVSAYLATKQPLFLPARRYASAGTSYGPVSVCLSVTSRCSIEVVGRIELVFGVDASFDQLYTVF